MKIVVCFLACLVSTLGLPTAQEEEIDWHHIKPIDLNVEPIGPAPDVSGSRIVGGSVATRNGFPYQAALIINNAGFCGGSIISSHFILTAAHCVDGNIASCQVILGAHNPMVQEATQVTINAGSRILHSEWNRATLRNDIALLRLASTIPLGSVGISAIALAPVTAGTYAGSTAVLSGWGRTSDSSNAIASTLRRVDLPVITNALCQGSFGSSVIAQHICTSGAGGIGGCNGDSGGPLVVNGVQVGIVSFGSSVCSAGHPTVFARVSHFRQWIFQNCGF